MLLPGDILALFGAPAELKDQRELSSVATPTAEDFVARLATVSAYLKLPPGRRADALREVRAVLPDRVDIDTTVQLSLARRADRTA